MPVLHRSESGFAMVTAMMVMVVAAGLVSVIAMASIATKDRARDRFERSLGNAPVDDAITTYMQSLNAGVAGEPTYYQLMNLSSGEYNGFRLPRGALVAHAAEAGGTVLANGHPSIPPALRTVDPSVPPQDRLTMRVPSPGDASVYRYWHVYAIVPPIYGFTPGGKVIAYFRGWAGTSTGTNATKPVMVRAEFRPGRFADYQLLSDGQINLGPGAVVNGKVHSNGFNASLNNQYANAPWQVNISSGATCATSARITTTSGSIAAGGAGCAGKVQPATGELVNLLRVKEAVTRMRRLCGQAAPTVRVICFQGAPSYKVHLAGSSSAPGGTALTVYHANGANVMQADYGTVLVFDNTVSVSGQLGGRARLTIATATRPGAGSTEFGGPSIWFTRSGPVGSLGGLDNAVGLIAEGDIIADERTACPLRIRGAMIATSGLFSNHPTWRSPFPVAGGSVCAQSLTVEGSLVGHLPPAVRSSVGDAGYAKRLYLYNSSLFDNPPPLFPTTGNWDLLEYSNADLDCFDAAGRFIRSPIAEKCR